MKKEFFWVDIIVVATLFLIGYWTDFETNSIIAIGISILGLHALISGKATIGNTCYYHSNKVLGRLMGAFQLLLGYVIFFVDPPL